MAALTSALPRRLRAKPIKGRGVSGANIAITAKKDGPAVNAQVKVIQKGDRGFSKVSKYMETAPDGTVTGLKPVERDLPVVIVVLDPGADNTIYVSTVGGIQDAMQLNYDERVAKNPDTTPRNVFYRPNELGADANDWSAITDQFAPKQMEVEETTEEPVVTEVATVPLTAPAPIEIPAEIDVPELEATTLEDIAADLNF